MLKEPTVRKSIQLAIEAEKLGAMFYERVAKKFGSRPDLVEIFLGLAHDERSHGRRFEELLAAAPADDPIAASDYSRDEYLRAVAVSEFFRGDLDASLEDIGMPADALRTGILLERATIAFYQALRDTVPPSSLIETLIAEEKKHYVTLFGRLEREIAAT